MRLIWDTQGMMKPQYQVLETSHLPDGADDVIFAPLVHLVGESNASQYMFMVREKCVSLGQALVVRGYKHSTTRDYVYLDNSGNFYTPVKARHCPDEYAYESLPKRDGICKLIDNALAYYKEGVNLRAMQQEHFIKGEI